MKKCIFAFEYLTIVFITESSATSCNVLIEEIVENNMLNKLMQFVSLTAMITSMPQLLTLIKGYLSISNSLDFLVIIHISHPFT